MNIEGKTRADRIDLNADWTVRRADDSAVVAIDFPSDIHSALLAEGRIADPYWRDTEVSLDWVHKSEWIAERRFTLTGPIDGRHVLTLDGVDCVSVVDLNGTELGRCENQFLRYDLEVGGALVEGENVLAIRFVSNSAEATRKAAESLIAAPYLSSNNRLPHYNQLRKSQCDAGWDWNIALSPLGIRGSVALRRIDDVRLDDVRVGQCHQDGRVRLDVTVFFDATTDGETEAGIAVDQAVVRDAVTYWPGENRATLSLEISEPRLWWPAGHGAQEMYDVIVWVGRQEKRLRIGLRTVEVITDPDAIGQRFAFRINGREIFMRGANWIPADALPGRATPERVRDLLTSAVEANMNMLRVWGGGQYEPDWFYLMCSEMGILIWQDFMFACNLYPAHDRRWLDLVRTEARQQLRRLSAYPCIALWCGDNELVGALNWYAESRNDRDRYVAIYDRLNHALDEAVEDEAVGVPFWPSSPSGGRLCFESGWHNDRAGDMHFWDVWHEAKDFEHYRTVRPRFCSEFGFQSFPSLRVIESFTEPDDRNVSSAVMEVHQRNQGGNSRIVETLARYFRFPDSFEDMAYLSQVSQGLAMKTAIEFWRSSKPRCMGTLYWQFNDTWPVASWSGLDYGGGWKLNHYMARRFYDPVLVTAQPDDRTGEVVVYAINDTPAPVSLSIGVRSVHADGDSATLGSFAVVCPVDQVVEVARFGQARVGGDAFLHLDWTDTDGRIRGENDFLPRRPKTYRFGKPAISVGLEQGEEDRETIVLSTDRPALFVTYDHGSDDIYSDNCFTLLPDRPKRLSIVRKRHSHLPEQEKRVRYLGG